MSWQEFVDTVLMEPNELGQALEMAAIIGHDGSIWARTSNFPDVLPEEIEVILKNIDDDAFPSEDLAASGIHIGGQKYIFIGGEPKQYLRGRKGKGGLCIKKSTTAIVVGIYTLDNLSGYCNVKVEDLGDYLMQQGL